MMLLQGHTRQSIKVTLLTLVILMVSTAWGRVEISGDLAITGTALDKHAPVNTNFRGDDPFDLTRLRLFVRTQATENIGVYTEILLDNEADVRMNGAYVYVQDIIANHLDLKAGMIPSPFGNYGLRSTYFNLNPLIGVPALWHYKTGLTPNMYVTNEDLINPEGEVLNHHSGVVLGYDACWDIGVEALFFWPGLEVSGAITAGSMGNPRARFNDGYQVMGKFSILPVMGVRLGASFARGPFMTPSADAGGYLLSGTAPAAPTADSQENQTTVGIHGEWLTGHWQWFLEAAQVDFDTPYVFEKKLTVQTAYVEGRWDFLPGYYLAGRYDVWRYSKIAPYATGSGGNYEWGYDFNRMESALGWRVNRQTLMKLDFQYWDYLAEPDLRLAALQMHLAF
ncbi:MAG: hypothetical protein K9N11_10040 [Lentisphaeria bacterium]|nr:hypothetical protein [Candidatus Neomarinimicrobiota bacterium]MCF7843172.1 hypothetical protein [Lentisphaeria bacterium]